MWQIMQLVSARAVAKSAYHSGWSSRNPNVLVAMTLAFGLSVYKHVTPDELKRRTKAFGVAVIKFARTLRGQPDDHHRSTIDQERHNPQSAIRNGYNLFTVFVMNRSCC